MWKEVKKLICDIIHIYLVIFFPREHTKRFLRKVTGDWDRETWGKYKNEL